MNGIFCLVAPFSVNKDIDDVSLLLSSRQMLVALMGRKSYGGGILALLISQEGDMRHYLKKM